MNNALYILGQLSDDDVEWLLQNGVRRDLPSGGIIIHEGQPADALYVLLEGALSVSLTALGGKEIDHKSPGEIVGEMSFVDARPPSATVSAAGRAIVFAIDRTRLAAKLEQDTAFAARFYRSLAIFLSDRLRHALALMDANGAGLGNAAGVDEDELDLNVLDTVYLAGTRFNRMLQRLLNS